MYRRIGDIKRRREVGENGKRRRRESGERTGDEFITDEQSVTNPFSLRD